MRRKRVSRRTAPGGVAARRLAEAERLFQDFKECLALYCEEVLPPKLELDTRYVRTRNSFLDLFILMRTALLPLELPRAQFRAARPAETVRRVLPITCVVLLAVLLVATFVVTTGPLP